MPNIYGCSGCETTGGPGSCPVHGRGPNGAPFAAGYPGGNLSPLAENADLRQRLETVTAQREAMRLEVQAGQFEAERLKGMIREMDRCYESARKQRDDALLQIRDLGDALDVVAHATTVPPAISHMATEALNRSGVAEKRKCDCSCHGVKPQNTACSSCECRL